MKKENPIIFSTQMVQAILDGRKTQTRRVIKPQPLECHDSNMFIFDNGGEWYSKKPRYQPGDILWVRETWAEYDRFYYKATEPDMAEPIENGDVRWFKWKPSIHMPRKAARIFLRVTDVRVERLQEISEEDAQAEGIEDSRSDDYNWGRYSKLWDTLNAKRGYGWDVNPWVWVYEFERIDDK